MARLIDADALEEEIKENMENGFPANEYLSLYALSCIVHAPTVCDIEQIRAEIEELDRYYDNDYFSTNNCPMYKCNDVLQIIDKYMKGE